jgi:hypothetical protein
VANITKPSAAVKGKRRPIMSIHIKKNAAYHKRKTGNTSNILEKKEKPTTIPEKQTSNEVRGSKRLNRNK